MIINQSSGRLAENRADVQAIAGSGVCWVLLVVGLRGRGVWGSVRLLLGYRTSLPRGRQRRGAVRGERSYWPAGAPQRSWRSREAARRCCRTGRSARETAARGPPSWPRSGSASRCDQVSRAARGASLGWLRMHWAAESGLPFSIRGAPEISGPLPPSCGVPRGPVLPYGPELLNEGRLGTRAPARARPAGPAAGGHPLCAHR